MPKTDSAPKPSSKSNESTKSNLKIILISTLVICLLAVSVSAYLLKDKILAPKYASQISQADSASKNLGNATQSNETQNKNSKPQSDTAFPLLIVQGFGYEPKAIADYNKDQSPIKAYPDVLQFAKIYDQNNTELTSPKIEMTSKIIQDRDNYYIINEKDTKKAQLWNPKSNTVKSLEMPIEFDPSSFGIVNGKIYLSELNSFVVESASTPKCGDANDEIGKCSVYEVDPETLKASAIVAGVRSGFYGGVIDGFATKDDNFIWLTGETGDGGIGIRYFRKYDIKTKDLISTVKIRSEFTDESLSYTPAGKSEQQITKIKCVDPKGPDPSVSVCTQKEKDAFDAEVYKLVPKELYKRPDQVIPEPAKITCGKYEIAEAQNDPAQPDAYAGKEILFDGKPTLNLKQLNINNSICIEN